MIERGVRILAKHSVPNSVFIVIAMGLAIAAGCGEDSNDLSPSGVIIRDVTVDVDGVIATVRWATDSPVTGFVRYRAAADSEEISSTDTAVGLQHEVALDNLAASTRYEFSVVATRDTGEQTMKSGGAFTTRNPGEPGPLLLAVTAEVTNRSVSIQVEANESVTIEVVYGDDGSLGLRAASTQADVTHLVLLSGLDPETTYSWMAVAEDTSGNRTESDVATFETPAEPKDDVREISVSAKQWEFTPTTIRVPFGARVRITLTTADVTHGFDLNRFNVNQPINPGGAPVVEFIADREGEFPFICNIDCGAGHATMNGMLIVE